MSSNLSNLTLQVGNKTQISNGSHIDVSKLADTTIDATDKDTVVNLGNLTYGRIIKFNGGKV